VIAVEHREKFVAIARHERRRFVPRGLRRAIASFLLSMDNISLSLFITRNDTLPLRLMQHMLSYTDPTVAAMSVMLLLISLALLLALLPFIARGQLD
jgi:putative spermidine/putrescine transport system permease protein